MNIFSFFLFLGFFTCVYGKKKEEITLYFEALCPYCRKWILKSLFPIYNSPIFADNFEVSLVPYGNAKVVNGTVVCQHGVEECELNEQLACGLHYAELYPNISNGIGFAFCVEDTHNAEKCSIANNIDWKWLVSKCYKHDLGEKLTKVNEDKTAKLSPPHSYVPWVTVGNSHMPTFESDLPHGVCMFQDLPPNCLDEEVETTIQS
eukprot:Platyproteum_vivax@DN2786_c0_g1_i1.p1